MRLGLVGCLGALIVILLIFGVWFIGVRNHLVTLDLAAIFQESRDHGLEPTNIAKIAQAWAARVAMTEADVRKYLTSNIYYYLDDDCLDGLRLFYRYAGECGALPQSPDLHFADVKPALI